MTWKNILSHILLPQRLIIRWGSQFRLKVRTKKRLSKFPLPWWGIWEFLGYNPTIFWFARNIISIRLSIDRQNQFFIILFFKKCILFFYMSIDVGKWSNRILLKYQQRRWALPQTWLDSKVVCHMRWEWIGKTWYPRTGYIFFKKTRRDSLFFQLNAVCYIVKSITSFKVEGTYYNSQQNPRIISLNCVLNFKLLQLVAHQFFTFPFGDRVMIM